ncbi:MAG: PKD domain-containing protein, partial [Crocinitomicaceae bacterium]
TYSVTLTKNGCSSTDQMIASYISPASVDLGVDQTICQGNTVNLDVTSPSATYLWSNGSTNPIMSISQSGIYSVELNHYCGMVKDTIEVIVNALPTVNLGNDTTLCNGETLALDATELGATYSWQDGSTNPTYSINQAGTYSVTLTKSGCLSTDQIEVNYSTLSVELGNNIILCEGETTNLNVQSTPNTSYLWQDGSQLSSFLVTIPGIYSVTLNEAGCSVSDFIEVEYETLNKQISYLSKPFCGYAELNLSANPISNTGSTVTDIQWTIDNNRLYGHNIETELKSAGVYQVEFSAVSASCLIDTLIQVIVSNYSVPKPNFSVSNYKPAIEEELVVRNFTDNATSYIWSFGNGDESDMFEPEFFYQNSGTYKINLTALNDNCESSISQIVKVEEQLIYYIPNAFSPDGNQFNETFKPVFSSGYDVYNYELRIFNRLGELVFISNDSNVGWDGLYNGAQAENGTYIWQVLFGQEHRAGRIADRGTVTLLR